jgi:hypothetical protein
VLIISHKKDIAAYIATTSALDETKTAYVSDLEEDEREEAWAEVTSELLSVITHNLIAEHPPYGADWETWLKENIDELVEEAVSIVM